MILMAECFAACVIFTIVVLPAQYKNPMKYIMSYPPEIRQRAESLPQYENSIQNEEKEHKVRKICAVFICVAILAAVAYFSGAVNFGAAFVHVFCIFLAVNLYDMLVLDIGVFCHSKKLRIPGTEDMDKEYKNYLFHIKGACKGMAIGVALSLLAAGMVSIAVYF